MQAPGQAPTPDQQPQAQQALIDEMRRQGAGQQEVRHGMQELFVNQVDLNRGLQNTVNTLVRSMQELRTQMDGMAGGRFEEGGADRVGKSRVKCPEFSGEANESWPSFKARFLAFAQSHRLSEEDNKINLFVAIGGSAAQLITGMGVGTPTFEGTTALEYLELISGIFNPAAELGLARQRFYERRQSPTESVQAYAAHKRSLYQLAFPDQDETALVVAFIENLANGAVMSQVQHTGSMQVGKAFPNLSAAVNSALEAVANQRLLARKGFTKDISGLSMSMKTSVETVNASIGEKKQAASERIVDMDISTLRADPELKAMLDQELNAFDGNCYNCNKFGHSIRFCTLPKRGGAGRGGSTAGAGRWRGTGARRGRSGRRDAAGRFTRSFNALGEEEQDDYWEDEEEEEEGGGEELEKKKADFGKDV